MLLTKKLRLAAAGLTDVGRRRERNQDNVTHYVPADENELAEKGALFVVCDGMGGHAAGEVASELGVNAIRDVYYKSNDEDVIGNIANAIKSANDAIFTYAHDHPESSGMGTTCVAALIQGGRAFFVNIGDSRAYLARDGSMRQVTLDHSWVAEQVRAGMLTEEQARTHAHRNVITRSLGTQPTVTADLFVETLKQGDRILLCSDGLHGYVEEREIEYEMLQHEDPEEGVKSLVDMANNNGGPDNITALVIQLIEVPPATGELNLPTAGSQDEQTITQPLPAIPVGKAKTSPPAAAAVAASLPAEKIAAQKRRGNPIAVAAVRVLAIAAVLALLIGAWDFTFGPYAQMHAATQQLQADVTHAQQAASQASQQDPATALAHLSQARKQLLQDLQNPQADLQIRQSAQNVLDGQLVPAVQDAVQRYDTAASIKQVDGTTAILNNVSCTGPQSQTPASLSSISALVATAPPGQKSSNQTLFAINNGILYQMTVPLDASTGMAVFGTVTCVALALPNVATVVALASDSQTLFVLAQQNPTTYEVLVYAPNGTSPTGQSLLKNVAHFGLPTSNGEVPALIAAQGITTYISYSVTGGASGIWVYTSSNKPKGPAKTVTLTQAAMTLVATNNTLYAILADGSLGQLDATQTFQPLQVAVQTPLSPNTPGNYTSATPVPTVPGSTANAAATSNTTFTHSAVLAADPNVRTIVYLGDGTNNRVVQFSASGVGPGIGLAHQFVYAAPLVNMQQLALAENTPTANGAASVPVLNVYGWNGSQLSSFSIATPAGS